MVEREFNILSKLNHKIILKFHDFFRIKDYNFVVFDHLGSYITLNDY